jgi:hypothetical protein
LSNPPGPSATCPQGQCFRLPAAGAPHGSYLPSSQIADALHFNLGNPGSYTAIPVHATYRYLYGKSGIEAASLGLPIPPVPAQSVNNLDEAFPGPFSGPPVEFQAYMQPGLYERTITPDPPLDSAFPPDVNVVDAVTGLLEEDKLDMLDSTGGGLPTFHISHHGGLDGWTTYLRDTSTGRRISTVVQLSGSDIPGVILPTNHHPPGGDALNNAALVVAPPQGDPIPAQIFTKIGVMFPTDDILQDLPIPANVRGTVVAADGQTPVEADLVFELTGAYADNQKLYMGDQFEFDTVVHARLDPTTDTVPFFVSLPRGTYRLSIRPVGGASAVTVINPFTVQFAPDVQDKNVLTASRTFSVSGFAEVADSRQLSGATVYAVPTECVSMAQGTSSACLPRMRLTTTGANGAFGICDAQGNGCPLLLDPGDYVVQVRPAAGTRLPWVYLPYPVSTDATLPFPFVIPAPVYAGLDLHDPFENPIVRAVVSVFTTPCAGHPAIEVGQAITDENGHYDMYLDPTIVNMCP